MNDDRKYPPTCRQLQDAAIADLQVAAGYAQAATERLTRELAELRARVDAWEAEWEMPDPPSARYEILEPVRDDALDDECMTVVAAGMITADKMNQTYSWLPGDAWDQFGGVLKKETP